jgi:hypothetical protein
MDNRKEMREIRAKRFETEEMAQEVVNELNKHSMGQSFCPIIKEQCRTDCECFVAASVGQQIYSRVGADNTFKVEGFYCDNAMFYHND